MGAKTKIGRNFLSILMAAVMVFSLLPIMAFALTPEDTPPFHISGSDYTDCNDLYIYQNEYNGKSCYFNQGIIDPNTGLTILAGGSSMIYWENNRWELHSSNQVRYYSTSTSNGINPPTDGWVRGTGTIDGDFLLSYGPTFYFQTNSITVDESTGVVQLPIKVSENYEFYLTMDYTVTSGTAQFGSDFNSSGGTLSFNSVSAADSYTLSIPITDDDTYEPNETFTVTLTGASGAADAGGNPCTVTIVSDDPQPTVGFDSAAVTAEEGSGELTIPISLTNPSGTDTTVQYETSNGTAESGTDFQAASGTLTIPAGSTSANIPIQLLDNTVYDGSKSFAVSLSNPSGATLGTASAAITLTDNETLPTLGFSETAITANEEDGTVTLPVLLSGPAAFSVTADYATSDGTAVAGDDYTSTSGTITIPAGSTTATITIPITDDALYEGSENFSVVLTNITGVGSGTTTITVKLVDAEAAPILSFSNSAITVNEADGSVTLTVTSTNSTSCNATVEYFTSDGSALAGVDYASQSGTLTIPAGETSATIQIPIINDAVYEGEKQFTVSIRNPVNATLGTAVATVTLTDDDPIPSVSFSDPAAATLSESNATVSFDVVLSSACGDPVTVHYATSDGSAVAGGDYTAQSGTLTIPAGSTSAIITILLTDDTLNEDAEAFTVTLSDASGAALGTAVATVTLTDDDAPALTPYAPALVGTDEDTAGASVAVSALLGTHADADAGIAVINKSGNGTWQYSTDGTDWASLGDVSEPSSVLLSPNTLIRYVPDGIRGEEASITYRAWDGSTGTASTNAVRQTIDTSVHGGASAFSAMTDTATISVSDINDAPTDISLTFSSILAADTGANAVVGTLSATDIDTSGPFTYSLTTGSGDFNIDGNSLRTSGVLAEGSYDVRIQVSDGSASYEKTFVITVANLSGKTLTADTTGNSVDNDMEITFTEDALFAGKITSISFGAHVLSTGQYTISSNKIILHPGDDINNYLRTPAIANVVISAQGYTDSVVSQTITAGTVNSLEVITQPLPGAETGETFATQPVVTLKDQYGNICADGASAAAAVTASATPGTGTWLIGGTVTIAADQGVAAYSNLVCTLDTPGAGKIHFEIGGTTVDSNAFSIPERNSTISPATASFDKYTTTTSYSDIEVTVTLKGNTLVSIKNGSYTLVEGTDYTSSGDLYSIKKEYLATLVTGSANLIFDFNMGANQVLTVNISDTTPSYSGSGPATPTQSYHADVNAGNGGATLPVTVEKGDNTASLDASSLSLTKDRTVITIPSVPDVNTYTIGIPVPKLSMSDVGGMLNVNTDTGSITVPSNMLAGIEGINGSKADISVGQGNKSTLPDAVKSSIGDRPLIQLTLSIDGKQINWSNPDAPITVGIPYTPTANELANPESIVVWYIDGSGNVVTIPNGHYDPATGMVTFDTTHFSDYAVAYNEVSFNDVPVGTWYNKAVSFIAARGITSGTGNGNYSPDAKLTRGEFIVLLMRAYGIAPEMNPTDNFSDAGSTYYTGYLAAAKLLGITSGVGNNQFAPGREITRQEMVTLLYNALKTLDELPDSATGKTLDDFADCSSVASWAVDAMTQLVEAGVISGSNDMLTPTGITTRAECAQVLYNLMA